MQKAAKVFLLVLCLGPIPVDREKIKAPISNGRIQGRIIQQIVVYTDLHTIRCYCGTKN